MKGDLARSLSFQLDVRFDRNVELPTTFANIAFVLRVDILDANEHVDRKIHLLIRNVSEMEIEVFNVVHKFFGMVF